MDFKTSLNKPSVALPTQMPFLIWCHKMANQKGFPPFRKIAEYIHNTERVLPELLFLGTTTTHDCICVVKRHSEKEWFHLPQKKICTKHFHQDAFLPSYNMSPATFLNVGRGTSCNSKKGDFWALSQSGGVILWALTSHTTIFRRSHTEPTLTFIIP